jgi:hypothetical protein
VTTAHWKRVPSDARPFATASVLLVVTRLGPRLLPTLIAVTFAAAGPCRGFFNRKVVTTSCELAAIPTAALAAVPAERRKDRAES